GGKGFATSLGVILAFNPWLGLLVILTWLLIFKLSKISSLSAIVSMIFAPLYAFLLMGNNAYFGATIIIALFVLYKHKANMKRLIKKQEQKM
ncbi:MAG TPA: glycerol-3-phosphate acyltransferase, partial [Burkholderiales bacterium]|nr:glycerol-3-phosphate acyltransferase [Burkholderiales bacterium]